MFTDDHLRREIEDILNRKPDATRKEIVKALYWRATLKWGRVPETVKVWYREYNSPAEILAKYSPDQRRVPAGNSDGGQWTRDPNSSEGGSEARQNATYDYLRDKKGNLLRNINGDPIPYPRAFPPEFFLARAEAALPQSESFSDLLKSTDQIGADILKFRQGQMWDMQRLFADSSHNSGFNENIRDYSTVAIGVYSAGIKIPKAISLGGQSIYAALYSVMPATEEKWKPLVFIPTNFPMRNKHNTALGYKLANELRDKK